MSFTFYYYSFYRISIWDVTIFTAHSFLVLLNHAHILFIDVSRFDFCNVHYSIQSCRHVYQWLHLTLISLLSLMSSARPTCRLQMTIICHCLPWAFSQQWHHAWIKVHTIFRTLIILRPVLLFQKKRAIENFDNFNNQNIKIYVQYPFSIQ